MRCAFTRRTGGGLRPSVPICGGFSNGRSLMCIDGRNCVGLMTTNYTTAPRWCRLQRLSRLLLPATDRADLPPTASSRRLLFGTAHVLRCERSHTRRSSSTVVEDPIYYASVTSILAQLTAYFRTTSLHFPTSVDSTWNFDTNRPFSSFLRRNRYIPTIRRPLAITPQHEQRRLLWTYCPASVQ